MTYTLHEIYAIIIAFVVFNVLSQNQNFISHYETQIGLTFPQSVIDLACLASTFPSKFKQINQYENSTCYHILKNYTEIKQIDNLIYDQTDESFISNRNSFLGIKGVHLKVFQQNTIDKNGNQYIFIIIRHQEHESYLTDEMNEMMSLFGPAATVDRQRGNKEVCGAATVSAFIRFVRKTFGLDYLSQAISMFNKIQVNYKQDNNSKYIFSGFSAGGLYAIGLATYFNFPAITFSATGVEDILTMYYSDLFHDKYKESSIPSIFNFAHELDPIPKLDCQLGTLCLYRCDSSKSTNEYDEEKPEIIHLKTIFDHDPQIIQWLNEPEKWTCTKPDNYNFEFGSCKRERLRWQQRIEFNSIKLQTDRNDL